MRWLKSNTAFTFTIKQPSKLEETKKNAKKEHNFYFYSQTANQERNEIAKVQHSFHFYDEAAKQEDKKKVEQHSFHFRDPVSNPG